MTPALHVLRPGALATVQDLGRPEAQRFGVPTGGAMDRFALAVANRLVNNAPSAAALELTRGDAAFELVTPLLLALTGADLGATLDGVPLPGWTAAYARTGQELHVCQRRASWGARGYLAIGGGVDVPELLGSRATSLAGAFGGTEGRPLRVGDVLRVGAARRDTLREAGSQWPSSARPRYTVAPALRILPGPHLHLFAEDALTHLAGGSWKIGEQSNRMGYRLEGSTLKYRGDVSIASHGVVSGALQVPPEGKPILLMADAQPTGGYPIIAVVIAADLPLAAQLLPGDTLRFTVTVIDEAVAAWRRLKDWAELLLLADESVEQLAWSGALDT